MEPSEFHILPSCEEEIKDLAGGVVSKQTSFLTDLRNFGREWALASSLNDIRSGYDLTLISRKEGEILRTIRVQGRHFRAFWVECEGRGIGCWVHVCRKVAQEHRPEDVNIAKRRAIKWCQEPLEQDR